MKIYKEVLIQILLHLGFCLLLLAILPVASQAQTFTCPPDVTIFCGDGLNPFPGGPDFNPELGSPNGSQCTETPAFNFTDEVIQEGCTKIIERTWTLLNGCHGVTCVQQIRIEDVEAPIGSLFVPIEIFGCANEQANIEEIELALSFMVLSNILDGDACDPEIEVRTDYDPNEPFVELADCGPGNPKFVKTINWELEDHCGFISTFTSPIHIFDTTPPLMAGTNFEVECQDPEKEQKVLEWLNSINATDDCSDNLVIENNLNLEGFFEPVTCISPKDVSVEFSTQDDCGNSSNLFLTLSLVDNLPPEITCPEPITVELVSSIERQELVLQWRELLEVEDCNNDYTVAHSAGFNNIEDDCPNVIIYQNEFFVHDICNATSSCSSSVTFEDTTPPDVTCPDGFISYCSDPLYLRKLEFFLNSVKATDLSEVVSIENDFSHQGYDLECSGGSLGTQVVTFTATDVCGNVGTCSVTIQFLPDPPEIICPADKFVECIFEFEETEPLVNSPCDLILDVKVSEPILISGTNNCPGARYSIIYTVVDDCGGSASCEQILTIYDNDGPEITCASEVIIECADDIIVNINDVIVDVPCEPGYTVEISEPIRTGFPNCPNTTYTYIYTVTDACGRTASCDRVFRIMNVAPTITCPADQTVSCATAIVVDEFLPVVVSSCDNFVSIDPVGPTLVSGQHNCNGAVYEVTYYLTDACGRTADCTQRWTLDNPKPKIVEAPADRIVSCRADVIATPELFKVEVACQLPYEIIHKEIQAEQFSPNCPGAEYVIEYMVIDNCGRFDKHLQKFTIDNEAPAIYPPDHQFITCLSDINANFNNCYYETSCGLQVLETDLVGPVYDEDEPFCQGTVVNYLYSVTDECGRTSLAAQAFTFDFSEALQMENMTVDCDEIPAALSLRSCIDADLNMIENEVAINENDYRLERTYVLTDPCGNAFEFLQDIIVLCDQFQLEGEHCTYTDKEWGDRETLMQLTKDFKSPLITEEDPLVLGIKGERSLIIESIHCIPQMFPGWGSDQALPAGEDIYASVNYCSPDPLSYDDWGHLENRLASHTAALDLNTRLDTNMRDIYLSAICLEFPEQVIEQLGENAQIRDLLKYANEALAGQHDNLEQIRMTVSKINDYFNGCREIPCDAMQPMIQISEATEEELMTRELSLEAFPNPVQDIVHVQMTTAQNSTVQISLYNTKGILVKSETVANTSGQYSLEWNLQTLPSGLYYIKATDQSGVSHSLKIAKQH